MEDTDRRHYRVPVAGLVCSGLNANVALVCVRRSSWAAIGAEPLCFPWLISQGCRIHPPPISSHVKPFVHSQKRQLAHFLHLKVCLMGHPTSVGLICSGGVHVASHPRMERTASCAKIGSLCLVHQRSTCLYLMMRRDVFTSKRLDECHTKHSGDN